ncbi:hypothetical protein D049_2706A, partial [Vibrio parahaemolyticus VPTS-2010]
MTIGGRFFCSGLLTSNGRSGPS